MASLWVLCALNLPPGGPWGPSTAPFKGSWGLYCCNGAIAPRSFALTPVPIVGFRSGFKATRMHARGLFPWALALANMASVHGAEAEHHGRSLELARAPGAATNADFRTASLRSLNIPGVDLRIQQHPRRLSWPASARLHSKQYVPAAGVGMVQGDRKARLAKPGCPYRAHNLLRSAPVTGADDEGELCFV